HAIRRSAMHLRTHRTLRYLAILLALGGCHLFSKKPKDPPVDPVKAELDTIAKMKADAQTAAAGTDDEAAAKALVFLALEAEARCAQAQNTDLCAAVPGQPPSQDLLAAL